MRATRSGEWECELREFLFEERRRRATQKVVRRAITKSPMIWLRYTLITIVALIVLKASFVEAFFVPTGSMTPTIRANDYLLVPKFLYGLHIPLIDAPLLEWSRPGRGDIIVFKRSVAGEGSGNDPVAMIKRVIALEGDFVEIVDAQVYINGIPLVEPYVKRMTTSYEGYHFGPFQVPADRVFVLGDNRANSEDSRFWTDPFVPISQVIGKAFMVYWSERETQRTGIVL
jgi:signal peptidase I